MKPGLARTLLSHLPLLPQRLRAPGDEPAKTGAKAGAKAAAKAAEAVPIEKIEWREFEQLVTESFRRRGYHTPDTARPADAGGDQILRRDRETYLLHCKYWRHAKVDVGALQALHKAMLARNVSGAFVVSFGRFGRDAVRFASTQRIQVIDGPALKLLLESMRATLAKAPAHAAETDTEPAVQRAIPESPPCPLCGKAMRMRMAKRGSHAGRGFWGCIAHPDCKGIRPIV